MIAEFFVDGVIESGGGLKVGSILATVNPAVGKGE